MSNGASVMNANLPQETHAFHDDKNRLLRNDSFVPKENFKDQQSSIERGDDGNE